MINGKPKPRRVRPGPGAGRRPKNARRARQVPASGLCACSSANYPQACPRDLGISSAESMGDVSDLGQHAIELVERVELDAQLTLAGFVGGDHHRAGQMIGEIALQHLPVGRLAGSEYDEFVTRRGDALFESAHSELVTNDLVSPAEQIGRAHV